MIDSDHVRIWDVASGKQTTRLPIKGHAVAFSVDGRTLAASGYGIYRVGPGEKASLIINEVALRPMNRVALWDVATNKEIAAVEGSGNAFAVSNDGRFFAVGRGSEHQINRQRGGIQMELADNTRMLTVRESLTGQVVQVFPAPEGAVAVAMSPDGTRLAVAQPNGSVKLLKLMSTTEKHTLELGELDRLWTHLGG